ncbi:MAG: protein O-mannosyl-transferase family, partial [Kiritimatiellia bacterium]
SAARHFFKTEDWWAAAATFLFSTVVFYYNMAPEVTLQDSGELVTGAFNFGVPHPPGYPLWALLGYIWSHVIVPFGNPAWRIGTMSVFTGGLTVGVLTLMMTRSTRVLLHAIPWSQAIEERLLHFIALMVGVSTGLLFGFNRGVWLWASVSEMRVLNAFSFVLIACTFFAWIIQPHRKGFLYVSLLIFGLSMTNHQTVGVMAGALVVGALAEGLDQFFRRRSSLPEADRSTCFPLLLIGTILAGLVGGVLAAGVVVWLCKLIDSRNDESANNRPNDYSVMMNSLTTFWELFVGVLFSLSAVFLLFAWLRAPSLEPLIANGSRPDIWRAVVVIVFAVAGVLGMLKGGIESWIRKLLALIVCIVVAAFYCEKSGDPLVNQDAMKVTWFFLAVGAISLGIGSSYGWVKPRQAMLYTALFLCGCAFYLYMPIASATNPPMNWGYASTKEGFLHAITRGQYEKLQMADPFGPVFGTQIWIFVRGLLTQYSWPLCMLGVLAFLVPTFGLFKRTLVPARAKAVLTFWAIAAGACALILAGLLMKASAGWDPMSRYEIGTLVCSVGLAAIAAATALCVWIFYERWLIFLWIGLVPLCMAAVTILRKAVLHLPLESAMPPLFWGLGLATVACLLVNAWLYLRMPGRTWTIFIWAAFMASSIGLIMIINPKLDKQEQEITIKFFAPAHGFYAMLIGYGIALLFGFLLWLWKRVPRLLVQVCCVALLALPYITYQENWKLCALGTHDFGYQFGYRMFCPGGGYPDMEKDAVLYGGTDPGRFVPTYMIFCESRVKPQDRYQSKNLPGNGSTFDRSDVYIITQNALADNTYMSYIRDHYDLSRPDMNKPETVRGYAPWRQFVFGKGWSWLDRAHNFPKEPIRIPTPDDSTKAFQQFVEDWKAGKAPPGADIKIEGGRVQVSGVQAVMAINGILAKWIFEWNKEKHSFYVEESYVIQWMYPYLLPAGVIMKIDKEPLPSPQQDRTRWDEIVAKDKAYWDTLTHDFTNREEFVRNKDAQKSFSKMRSAIAGLYLWRGMLPEAEYAFRQSLQLCPDSPEGCFRLADLLMNQHRYDDARTLMQNYLKVDEYNGNVKGFLNQIDALSKCDQRRVELQKKLSNGADINDVMELISIFSRMNMPTEMASLSMNMLNNSNIPPQYLLQLAQLCNDSRRVEMSQECFRRYLARMPQDSRIWIELGWTQLMMNQPSEGLTSWRKAVEISGEAARGLLRTDKRFLPLWQQPNLPEPFRQLIQQSRPPPGLDFGL